MEKSVFPENSRCLRCREDQKCKQRKPDDALVKTYIKSEFLQIQSSLLLT